MPGHSPSDTQKAVDPTPTEDSDAEEEDVFHDARFPADEEAVSAHPNPTYSRLISRRGSASWTNPIP